MAKWLRAALPVACERSLFAQQGLQTLPRPRPSVALRRVPSCAALAALDGFSTLLVLRLRMRLWRARRGVGCGERAVHAVAKTFGWLGATALDGARRIWTALDGSGRRWTELEWTRLAGAIAA